MAALTESADQRAANAPAAVLAEKLVSVIDEARCRRQYSTDGDVRVEGERARRHHLQRPVLICDGAAVNAKFPPPRSPSPAKMSGEVTCSERFEAQPPARITSQISTPKLVIQEGAIVDGQIRMGRAAAITWA